MRKGRPCSRLREVGKQAAVLVEDLRADRNPKLDGIAAGSMAIRPFPVAAALPPEAPLALEEGEVAQVGVGNEDDVSTVAAVTPVRTTLGDVLLAPEADRAVAAAAAFDRDAGPVVEQG